MRWQPRFLWMIWQTVNTHHFSQELEFIVWLSYRDCFVINLDVFIPKFTWNWNWRVFSVFMSSFQWSLITVLICLVLFCFCFNLSQIILQFIFSQTKETTNLFNLHQCSSQSDFKLKWTSFWYFQLFLLFTVHFPSRSGEVANKKKNQKRLGKLM